MQKKKTFYNLGFLTFEIYFINYKLGTTGGFHLSDLKFTFPTPYIHFSYLLVSVTCPGSETLSSKKERSFKFLLTPKSLLVSSLCCSACQSCDQEMPCFSVKENASQGNPILLETLTNIYFYVLESKKCCSTLFLLLSLI